jgi:hypothetical protein
LDGFSNIFKWAGFGSDGDDRSIGGNGMHGPLLGSEWAASVPSPQVCYGSTGHCNPSLGFYYVNPASTVRANWFDTCRNSTTGQEIVSNAYGQEPIDLHFDYWPTGKQLSSASGSARCPGGYDLVSSRVQTASGAEILTWAHDPAQSWDVTVHVTCQHLSTTASASVTQQFTPAPNAAPPNLTVPTCDTILPGGHLRDLYIEGGRPGSADPDYQAVIRPWSWDTETQYPACTRNAGSTAVCFLELTRGGESCMDGTADCALWTDPEIIGEMQCTWGPRNGQGGAYVVPITWCEEDLPPGLFAPDPEPSPSGSATSHTGILPPPDSTGSPTATGTGTGSPSPSVTGSGTGTGNPSTSPSSTSSASSSPSSTTSGQPSTMPSAPVLTSDDVQPGPGGGGDNSSCMSGLWSGWSWNPLATASHLARIILLPVECALMWAFVPKPQALDSFVNRIRVAYAGTAFGEWAAFAGDLDLDVPGGGCDGMHAEVDLMVTKWQFGFLSTCNEPWTTLALVVKTFLTGAIGLSSLGATIRTLGGVFGVQIPAWGRRDD